MSKPDKIVVSPAQYGKMRDRFMSAASLGVDAHAVTLAVLEDVCGRPVAETRWWVGEIAIEIDWRT